MPPLAQPLKQAVVAVAVLVATAPHPPQHREALAVPVEINILEHLAEPLALLVVALAGVGLQVRVAAVVAAELLLEPLALVAQAVQVTKRL